MSEDTHGGTKRKELKLINSGAFGCIFSPTLTCNGEVGSAKYITKIQKSERAILNELRISEKVRHITGYARFFAPVIKHCSVKIAKDRVNDLKKCEVFEGESRKTIESSSYISMKTRYVGDKDLRVHIFSNSETIHFLTAFFTTYSHLLKAIKKLVSNKIIHFDLKYNNVIFDPVKRLPIIIDFGQSWSLDEIHTEKQLYTAFFVFDQYDYWCIDILICSYIFQKVGYKESQIEMVTEAEINHIYDVFIHGKDKPGDGTKPTEKKILNDAYLYNILQDPNKMKNFKATLDEYVNQFINKRTWWELYEDLIKNANTWDSYSLAIIYLNMLDDVFLSENGMYSKLLGASNGRLKKFVELMESVVYSAPNKRPSIQTLLAME